TDVAGLPEIVGAWFVGVVGGFGFVGGGVVPPPPPPPPPLEAAVTVILKPASAVLAFESLTLRTMVPVVPTFEAVGMPVILPVVFEMLSHAGAPDMLKLSASPSASAADGVKAY